MFKIIKSKDLSVPWYGRYIIISLDGKILDDGQGYGYKSISKARACWNYKTKGSMKEVKCERDSREILQSL